MTLRSGYDVIVIARHGRPALSRKVHLTAAQYREWWGQYDEGGLAEGQAAPEQLQSLTAQADRVLSSSLRRAIETARMARGGRDPDEMNALFVEAALPPPPFGPLKLRPRSWGTVSRIAWFYGLNQGQESVTATRKRAKKAAKILETEASGERLIVLFAHGWFNRMIGTQLRRRGWKRTVNQGDLHWKFRQYERATSQSR